METVVDRSFWSGAECQFIALLGVDRSLVIVLVEAGGGEPKTSADRKRNSGIGPERSGGELAEAPRDGKRRMCS